MLETFAYIEINVFALIVLLLIYLNMHHLQEKVLYRQRLFTALILTSAIQLALDSILWALDGQPGTISGIAAVAATVIYCANSTMPFVFWSLYVDYQVHRSTEHTQKLIIPVLIPAVLNASLGMLSAYTGYLFYYDAQNRYHRGSLFLLSSMIWVFYFIYTTTILLINRKKLEKKHFVSLFIFMFPILLAGFVQLSFFGLSIIWASTAISIQIVFMNIQTGQLTTDYLTGLFNRRQLDIYLEDLEKGSDNGRLRAGIMVDLDAFKDINDMYGHLAGDEAIITAAKILRLSFRKTDLICRYGGDEFVVILERVERLEVDQAVERILQNTKHVNDKEKKPYKISFSIGYDIFDSSSGMTSQEFLDHIDALMYADKKSIRS